ncbi:MAG: glycosyltransferase family 2 protein [Candidatus Bathyarchaeia archaeon]|jgi:glycosyltransferase involved in cell wall biosynthesis
MVDVSVVISVFSRERANDVINCIEALKKQTMQPKEIIVVFDPDVLLFNFYKKLLDSSVKLVMSNASGLSSARNKGVNNCKSEIVAFIDDDAIAEPNWLYHLVSSFSDSKVIGVGGRIIPIWHSQNSGWFPEELYWIVGCSYKGLPTEKVPIRNPIGCNMAFKRFVFEKTGYFSTSIGRVGKMLMGHEDTEFGIRATNKLPGSTIIYNPQAIVYHKVSKNRLSFRYVLNRSYSEGFSKAVIAKNNTTIKAALGTEKTYLRNLILGTPKMLLQGNVQTGPSRCGTLWIATVMVFLGYFVGSRSSKY